VVAFFFAMGIFAVAAVIGTERLGRPLTDDEKKHFGALLVEHDYPGARLVALRFAHKLCGGRKRSAADLMGRVDLRLVRFGWNPSDVPLVRYLCRLVWSEWTHAASESETARKAEEGYFHELEAAEGLSAHSVEKQAVAQEARAEARESAEAQVGKLRALFEKAGDPVNLLWLEYFLEGETDVGKMAERAGRAVSEFYDAADRRKRAVRRLLAEEGAAPYTKGDKR
jgi:hypothetical protein